MHKKLGMTFVVTNFIWGHSFAIVTSRAIFPRTNCLPTRWWLVCTHITFCSMTQHHKLDLKLVYLKSAHQALLYQIQNVKIRWHRLQTRNLKTLFSDWWGKDTYCQCKTIRPYCSLARGLITLMIGWKTFKSNVLTCLLSACWAFLQYSHTAFVLFFPIIGFAAFPSIRGLSISDHSNFQI